MGRKIIILQTITTISLEHYIYHLRVIAGQINIFVDRNWKDTKTSLAR